MDKVVDKYNMRDRFMSILVSGFMEEDEYGDLKMNAIYSYHLDSFFELTEMLDFVSTTFVEELEDKEDQEDQEDNFEGFEEDLDNFLDDLGIETE